MAQSICSASPEGEEPQNATGGEDDCPACRGHGRKLVMLPGPADTAGGSPDADDAVLMASELATNALVHTASGSGGRFAVSVYRDGGLARVEVWDGGSATAPVARPGNRDGESGAGLGLVEMLARCWGHRGGPRGRVVWFEVTLSEATTCEEHQPSGGTTMPDVGALTSAELLDQAGMLFDMLAGTHGDPRADYLRLLLAEAAERAARLRGPEMQLCACGESFSGVEALDEHLMGVFLPADDIGVDGRVHAEVARGTTVPWSPAQDAVAART